MSDLEELAIANPRAYGPTVNPSVRRAICTFIYDPQGGFSARPYNIFRPSGLIIWGAPPMADVEVIKVGNMAQLSVSMGHLPARFFSMGQSFEQIAKLLEEGIEPASWGDFDTAEVGNIIRVIVRDSKGAMLGPAQGVELCMWGKTVRPW